MNNLIVLSKIKLKIKLKLKYSKFGRIKNNNFNNIFLVFKQYQHNFLICHNYSLFHKNYFHKNVILLELTVYYLKTRELLVLGGVGKMEMIIWGGTWGFHLFHHKFDIIQHNIIT